ncbi:heavy metal translocating P-type ATPase [Nereida sp. MMG025]|uniref:heavy metal translocating P-type ATPase n=1 Tax=Nereida sp. MMG025 TaxID=2909981 RepID=UPI001F00410C|nr:heavy metal translocating P-type ATPase [Nereida sp. MMG025]MCF6444542.1 cadmium-translocating P-type ATPase [Nereida sp. MMG025]
MTALTFEIDGLNCASCVGRAEAALQTVKGLQDINVNLVTSQARVQITSPQDVVALQSALEKAGKPARAHRYAVAIEGMSCASCVGRVEAALQAVPEVIDAQVNLAMGQAQIASLASDPKTVLDALDSIGYTASVTSDTTQAAHDDEAQTAKRAAIISALLTAPVFILEMGGHVFPAFHHFIHQTIGMQTSWMIQCILTTIVLVWPGRIFYQKGVPSLMRFAPDMNALVVLGASAAYLYSLVALFIPEVLPTASRVVYFEAAAVIVTLILVGRFLEARAKGQTGAAIRALVGLRPDTAWVERDGDVIECPLDEVVLGDVVQLRPGARVAVDGRVESGESWLDESMLTGEPLPVFKHEGAKVTAGTINGTGALRYRATAIGQDTVLARIITMVSEAQGARLPIQDLVNRVTAWFVPAVLVVASLTVAAWLIWGPSPSLSYALVAGVSVLIIACPCAMGLATPTSVMVGTGRAAQKGVLFRKGDALQALQGVNIVAFDKTGTLTEGTPKVTDVVALDTVPTDEVVAFAAALEGQSEHPIARAIVEKAKGQKLPSVTQFQSITGMGIEGYIGQDRLLVGNARLMRDKGVDLKNAPAPSVHTVVLVAQNDRLIGAITVADPIRESARQMIKGLKDQGLQTALISGDAIGVAQAVGAELGIDHVVADVMPDGKVAGLKDLAAGRKIAFVGDGINDAPALASADVGIAIGSGTDVAIEAADVVLMSHDLSAVQNAFAISHATLRNIRQNLIWAFGYNTLLIPVAAGVLFPFIGVLLSPALAAGAMALSSVFVVTNALRLKRA